MDVRCSAANGRVCCNELMSGCGTAEPCSARAFIHGDADTDGLVVEMGNASSGVGAVLR